MKKTWTGKDTSACDRNKKDPGGWVRMMVPCMEFMKPTDIMQCLQWCSGARKFNLFGYWHKNNGTTCKQPCSAHWRGSCMTRKSSQSLLRQMDTVLLASGERLFRSRLYIPSSGHLLRSLSGEMALQQNPRLVWFGFSTANHSCNKEEKTFCSEAARGPNEMWHIHFWAMKLYNPSGFTFGIQGSQRGWDRLFCENSFYFPHCLWLGSASYNHLWEQPLTWKTSAYKLLLAFVQRCPRNVKPVTFWNRPKHWYRQTDGWINRQADSQPHMQSPSLIWQKKPRRKCK